MIKKQEKLQWKVKHESNFKDEIDFLETILLDSGVKEEDIKANFKNGTLEITFPKEETKKLEDKKYIQIEGE